MKNFKSDFEKFRDLLLANVPFAFARYSDGELFILQNKELRLEHGFQPQDHKHFHPVTHQNVRQKLIEAFTYKSPNYYKGISCKCCVGEAAFYEQLALNQNQEEDLTWANLFVNSNYPLFLQEIVPIIGKRRVVMVCHQDADLQELKKCLVKDFRVGYNAMVNDLDKITLIKNWIQENNITDHLFLFSASTFSNLAIYELHKANNQNTYLDIGTCLAPHTKMPVNRSYLMEYLFNSPGTSDLKKTCIW
jgi:hypothetical protein